MQTFKGISDQSSLIGNITKDAHLSGRITELALERRRFGYRRIWQLLRREGLHVNHKRVYGINHLNGLSVKRRRPVKGWRPNGFRFCARMHRT
jgi:transposase InsO family protein